MIISIRGEKRTLKTASNLKPIQNRGTQTTRTSAIQEKTLCSIQNHVSSSSIMLTLPAARSRKLHKHFFSEQALGARCWGRESAFKSSFFEID